jgi:hypothetical protein
MMAEKRNLAELEADDEFQDEIHFDPTISSGQLGIFNEGNFFFRLGSVAGPVIQATGRSEFEDGLGSGDFVSGYSYHMSVRTRLSDHTKQTKFQSQRPTDVETPVPSISSTEVQQHRDSQYLDG